MGCSSIMEVVVVAMADPVEEAVEVGAVEVSTPASLRISDYHRYDNGLTMTIYIQCCPLQR